MDDVRGCFLGLPHGTTPAAVTTNKILKGVPLRAVKAFKRKGLGQTDLFRIINSSSVTLNELAIKARNSYCNFKLQPKSHSMTDINPNEIEMI